MIKRRKTRVVRIGNVKIGGSNPVSIQSMIKRDTSQAEAVLEDIKDLKKSGCDIIRVAVEDMEDAEALRRITARSVLPVVADIHFEPALALASIEAGAHAIRLNPGNITAADEIRPILQAAGKRDIPIRIGVNSGSLRHEYANDADGMVRSALDYIKVFEDARSTDIIISLKSSSVNETIEAYRKMAVLCDYPFHVGVTAAGPPEVSVVKSSIGIGALLTEGIGDTVRVSLTGEPREEAEIAKRILQACGVKSFGPDIISCPTCGRCKADLVGIMNRLKKRLGGLSGDDVPKDIRIAVMGCVVNGPGEAAEADVGIACGKGKGMLFKKGRKVRAVREDDFIEELIKEIKNLRND